MRARRVEMSDNALDFSQVFPPNLRSLPMENGLIKKPEDYATLIDYNMYLIEKLAQRGFRFLDIGPKHAKPSDFYASEVALLEKLGFKKIFEGGHWWWIK
jgi:hypothetical protein